jgi:TetR/AcrR family transcriptional regulator
VKANRKQQILEVLAVELESKPGSRITTAGLAQAVGVSEAALYRHFASKAKMYEALIEFSEESVFGLVGRILEEQKDVEVRCFQIGTVMLKFAERNPGIARLLMGDILLGENERLRHRVAQFFARLETQFNELLRYWAATSHSQKSRADVAPIANLLMAVISGRIAQFVRTDFRVSPCQYWDDQWRILSTAAFMQHAE